MKPPVARALLVLAFIGLAFLYYYRLGDAPAHLAHDEVMFGVVSHEIAWHARDVDGQFLPAFMHMNGVYWNMPAHVYLTAAFVRVLGTTESAIRASSATASLLSVLFVYLFCRRAFGHRGFAALAAGMLALSPALFIDSRLSTDHHYPLVAIGLWLICLARFFEDTGSDFWLGLAGLSLGAGLYTYGASVVLMPIYVAVTALLLWRMKIYRIRAYVVLGAVFTLAVLPFAVFLLRHPGYIGDVANMYQVYDAKRFNVLHGAREVLGWTSLSARSSVYYSYFSPSMLFFSGAGSLIQSTREAGFFLISFLVLLPGAIVYIIRRPGSEWFAWLAVVALLATPLAASVVDEGGAVQRVITMAPFGAILAAYLAMKMSRDPNTWLRVGTWLLVAWLPVSFARFYADYLGDYRVRSAGYFELNIGGALQAAIDETRATGGTREVCISRGINSLVDWYWKFYVRKNAVESLEPRGAYFNSPADVGTRCTASAVVVTEIATCEQVAAIRGGQPRKITEPSGSASFCVF